MAWSTPPSEFARVVRANHTKHMRKVASMALRSVIRLSPVDTGRFRSNWQLTEGSSAKGTIDSTSKAKFGNIDAAGKKSIAGAKEIKGNVLFITNNLPYAMELEHGHSTQAPNGMVALTIIALQGKLGKK